MLKGIPHAIMRHAHNRTRDNHEQQSGPEGNEGQLSSLVDQRGDNSTDSGSPVPYSAAGQGRLQAGWHPPELAVPQSLMLAVYPGESGVGHRPRT